MFKLRKTLYRIIIYVLIYIKRASERHGSIGYQIIPTVHRKFSGLVKATPFPSHPKKLYKIGDQKCLSVNFYSEAFEMLR